MTTGTYSELHRHMLMMLGDVGDRSFRADVTAAHMGLSIEQGRAVVHDLIEIGFVEREVVLDVRPVFWSYLPTGTRCEGPDAEGKYVYAKDTAYCRLTTEGRAEVERLRQQADRPATLPKLNDEIDRLRAENQRLTDEVHVLGVEDERLFDANRKLEAEVRRLRARLTSSGDKVLCPRCSRGQQRLASFCPRCGTRLGHEKPQMKRAWSGR